MKKFSNAENRRLAEKNGATLVAYNHNGESLRPVAEKMHENGDAVYYENQKPCKTFPKGASHLYKVDKA